MTIREYLHLAETLVQAASALWSAGSATAAERVARDAMDALRDALLRFEQMNDGPAEED